MARKYEAYVKQVAIDADMTFRMVLNRGSVRLDNGKPLASKKDWENFIDERLADLPFTHENEIVGEKLIDKYRPSITRDGNLEFSRDRDGRPLIILHTKAKALPMELDAEIEGYDGFLGCITKDQIVRVNNLQGRYFSGTTLNWFYRDLSKMTGGAFDRVGVKLDNVDGTILEPNYICDMGARYDKYILAEDLQKIEQGFTGILIPDEYMEFKPIFACQTSFHDIVRKLRSPNDHYNSLQECKAMEPRIKRMEVLGREAFMRPYNHTPAYLHEVRVSLIGMVADKFRTEDQIRPIIDLDGVLKKSFENCDFYHGDKSFARDVSMDVKNPFDKYDFDIGD